MRKEKYSTAYFDKETTNIIKGAALLLMLCHHFFTFPEWWIGVGGTYPNLIKWSPYFCYATKLCVSIFCFITGYFYYYNHKKKMIYSVRKIQNIMVHYWTALFFLSIIAIICGYRYDVFSIVKEYILLDKSTMYFCWYVPFYCLTMLLLPIIYKSIGKHPFIDFALLILPSILVKALILTENLWDNGIVKNIYLVTKDLLDWFPMVLFGYIVAYYDLFRRGLETFNELFPPKIKKWPFWILLIFCSLVGRYLLCRLSISTAPIPFIHESVSIQIPMDILYSVIFVYACARLCSSYNIIWVSKILNILGKHSLMIWFTHGVFFNVCKEQTQWILYWPKFPPLVLIWGTILSLLLAIPIEYVAKQLLVVLKIKK